MSKRSTHHGKKRKKRTIAQRRRAAAVGAESQGATGSASGARRSVGELMAQATEAHRAGQIGIAKQLYERILTLRPDEHRAMFGLAQIHAQFDETARSIELLERALSHEPENHIYRYTLSEVMLAAKRADEALQNAEKAVALQPNNHFALLMLATCLGRFNRYEEAQAAAEQACAAAPPGNPEASLVLARMYRANRRYAEAEELLRRILFDSSSQQQHAAVLKGAHHELGLVLDKLREYDQAYEALVTYNGIMAQTPLARRIDWTISFNEIQKFKAITGQLVKPSWSGDDFADSPFRAPAFLVGFPRSGTTLTEQILAAHRGVVTGDEQPFVTATGERAGQILKCHPMDALDRFEVDLVRRLRECYWERASAEFDTDLSSKILLDKLPLNIVHLVLINMVFPDSKIIVALRDPRDACLSGFMQNFTPNPSMIHFLTLEGAAKFYAAVMDYYLFMRDKLTLDMIEIRYEETVSDLETQAKKLLSHLNLDWDPGVLSFHEKAKERFISTPSFEAVTKPVHRGAVGRWKNYRKAFEPVLPILDRFVREFGYESE